MRINDAFHIKCVFEMVASHFEAIDIRFYWTEYNGLRIWKYVRLFHRIEMDGTWMDYVFSYRCDAVQCQCPTEQLSVQIKRIHILYSIQLCRWEIGIAVDMHLVELET